MYNREIRYGTSNLNLNDCNKTVDIIEELQVLQQKILSLNSHKGR